MISLKGAIKSINDSAGIGVPLSLSDILTNYNTRLNPTGICLIRMLEMLNRLDNHKLAPGTPAHVLQNL